MTVQADTQLKRLPERGSHDFDLACSIIDEARICHVGVTLNDQPYVIPMALGRLRCVSRIDVARMPRTK